MPTKKNLAGQTFAYWTVQGDHVYESSTWKWLCKCHCGTLKYVNERNLLSGRSKSCGCLSRALSKNRFKDLTGHTFGFLQALKRASEHKRGRVSWVCRCDLCGNLCVVTGYELQQGKAKSCGCLKRTQTTSIDLTDQSFERLTARYPTEKRDYKGSVIWFCGCSCGGEIEVSQDRLMSGNTKSCGCLKKEQQKNIHSTLRFVEGTCIEFLKRKKRSDNTSGHAGVYRLKSGRFRAGIGFKGKKYGLGTYDTFEEAVKAREYAEDTLHHAFIEKYDSPAPNVTPFPFCTPERGASPAAQPQMAVASCESVVSCALLEALSEG